MGLLVPHYGAHLELGCGFSGTGASGARSQGLGAAGRRGNGVLRARVGARSSCQLHHRDDLPGLDAELQQL